MFGAWFHSMTSFHVTYVSAVHTTDTCVESLSVQFIVIKVVVNVSSAYKRCDCEDHEKSDVCVIFDNLQEAREESDLDQTKENS